MIDKNQTLRVPSIFDVELSQSSLPDRQEFLLIRYINQKLYFLYNKLDIISKELKRAEWKDNDIVACSLIVASTYVSEEVHSKYSEIFSNNFNADPLKLEELGKIKMTLIAKWASIADFEQRVKTILAYLSENNNMRFNIPEEDFADKVKEVLKAYNLTAESKKERLHNLVRRHNIARKEMHGNIERERRGLIKEFTEYVKVSYQEEFAREGIAVYAPTFRCNLNCRHCQIVNRGMKRRVDTDKLQEYIDWCVKSGKVLLHITGGEIFKDGKAKEDVLYILRNSPITVSFNTNGFWALGLDETRAMIDKIWTAVMDNPYLSEREDPLIMQVSMDEFHQEVIVDKDGFLKEYIDMENIVNVLQVLVEGYPNIVFRVSAERTPSAELLKNELALELKRRDYGLFAANLVIEGEGVKDEVEIRHADGSITTDNMEDFFALKKKGSNEYSKNKLSIFKDFVIKTGWAELLEDFEYIRYHGTLEKLFGDEQYALETFRGVGLSSDGGITVASGLFQRIWSMGNVYEESIDSIIERCDSDILIWAFKRDLTMLSAIAQEVEPDIFERIKHLGHAQPAVGRILESSAMRLYLTQRLIQDIITEAATDSDDLRIFQLLGKIGLLKTIDELQYEYHYNKSETGQEYELDLHIVPSPETETLKFYKYIDKFISDIDKILPSSAHHMVTRNIALNWLSLALDKKLDELYKAVGDFIVVNEIPEPDNLVNEICQVTFQHIELTPQIKDDLNELRKIRNAKSSI
ncbi:MAG: radical SAM protein [Planctomycetota bacterium]